MKGDTKFASGELAAAASSRALADAMHARHSTVAAILARDAEAFAQSLASDITVNTPGNRVARRDEVIQRFLSDQISYHSFDTTIELVERKGDLVVIMGEEAVTPAAAAAHAGKTVRRRFTDVYRQETDGVWRLTIRQATNIFFGSVDERLLGSGTDSLAPEDR
jgi:ketosteroid isomerase-like protein